MGVIKYSSSVSTEFHLNQYNSKSAVLQAISDIKYIGGGTATHLGLQAILEEFSTYSRPVEKGVPRVAFVVAHGQSNDFDATVDKARELHTANLEVYVVAIGSGTNQEELSAIATRAENVLNTDFDIAQLKELQGFLDKEACEGMY